ncbi:MAG: flagellar capping protein [Lachnospiraceae bacterium]|nr:flagellar capping protein [Lachnospiraceae bacterium]
MISSVYNYYLSTYAKQNVSKSDTHKKSELKEIYNSMVKSSRKSPLYKIENTERVQKYAIDLKETARAMKNVAASMSDSEDAVAGFNKKKATSTNPRIATVKYIGEDGGTYVDGEEDKVPELTISVKNVASPQINVGNYLKQDEMDLKHGAYSFDIAVGDYAYEFQFNVGKNDTNRGIQDKLVRLINRSNIGATAEIVTNGNNESAMKLTSDATGTVGYRDVIFTVSHDKNSDTKNAVKYLGLDNIFAKPENAHFTINGIEKDTISNTFTVEGKYEITLNAASQTENDIANIGLKPDLDNIMENVSELIGVYNSMVDLAIEKTDGTYESGKLLRDVSSMAKLHKNELDAAGFTVEKDGHIKIDEALIIQSANEGNLSDNLHKLNSFKNAMVRRADNISINPMVYVDKKLIAYPHPTKNYPNPYVTSRYSGMMFSTVV